MKECETTAEKSKDCKIHSETLELAVSILMANIKLNEAINLAKELGYSKAEFLKITEFTADRLKWFAEKQYDYLESLNKEETK